MKRRFPTFATILLLVGVVWLLSDLKLLAIPVSFPWIPAILIIVALGMISNRLNGR